VGVDGGLHRSVARTRRYARCSNAGPGRTWAQADPWSAPRELASLNPVFYTWQAPPAQKPRRHSIASIRSYLDATGKRVTGGGQGGPAEPADRPSCTSVPADRVLRRSTSGLETADDHRRGHADKVVPRSTFPTVKKKKKKRRPPASADRPRFRLAARLDTKLFSQDLIQPIRSWGASRVNHGRHGLGGRFRRPGNHMKQSTTTNQGLAVRGSRCARDDPKGQVPRVPVESSSSPDEKDLLCACQYPRPRHWRNHAGMRGIRVALDHLGMNHYKPLHFWLSSRRQSQCNGHSVYKH